MRAVRWLAVAAAALLLGVWTFYAWPFLTPVYPEVPRQALLVELPWHGDYIDEVILDGTELRRTWSDGTRMYTARMLLPGYAAASVADVPPEFRIASPPTLATRQTGARGSQPENPDRSGWSAQYGQFWVALASEQDDVGRDRDIAVIDQNVAVQFHYAPLSARAWQLVRMQLAFSLIVGPWVGLGAATWRMGVRSSTGAAGASVTASA